MWSIPTKEKPILIALKGERAHRTSRRSVAALSHEAEVLRTDRKHVIEKQLFVFNTFCDK